MNISFITYQTEKLRSQRIMVKTTYKSDLPWAAIFSVIVFFCRNLWGWFDRLLICNLLLPTMTLKTCLKTCIEDRTTLKSVSKLCVRFIFLQFLFCRKSNFCVMGNGDVTLFWGTICSSCRILVSLQFRKVIDLSTLSSKSE